MVDVSSDFSSLQRIFAPLNIEVTDGISYLFEQIRCKPAVVLIVSGERWIQDVDSFRCARHFSIVYLYML